MDFAMIISSIELQNLANKIKNLFFLILHFSGTFKREESYSRDTYPKIYLVVYDVAHTC